jgi:hypothetical protein
MLILGWVLSYAIKTGNSNQNGKVAYDLGRAQIEKVQDKFKSFSSHEEKKIEEEDQIFTKLMKQLSKELKINIEVDKSRIEPINIKVPNPREGVKKGFTFVKKKIIQKRDLHDRENKNLAKIIIEEANWPLNFNENVEEEVTLSDVIEEYEDF